MNYIGEINAFERWLEHHPLELAPQLLMYKFYKLANRAGWPEWVSVDNLTLMVEMKTKREATVIGWRDKLIENDRITYKKGRKGIPNRYKITSFCNCTSLNAAQIVAEPVVQSVAQVVAQTVVQTAALSKPKPKPKTKTRTKEKGTNVPQKKFAPLVRDNPPTREEVKGYCLERGSSVDWDRFFDYFDASAWVDSKGNPVRNWKQKIIAWEGNHGSNGDKSGGNAGEIPAGGTGKYKPKYGNVL